MKTLESNSPYKKMLEEVTSFINTHEEKTSKLLVTRERTILEMREFFYDSLDRTDYGRYYELAQPPHSLQRIQTKRTRFALKQLEEADSKHLKKTGLYSFIKKCNDKRSKNIALNHQPASVSYHNNAGNYLYNNFSLRLSLYYRWIQQGKPGLDTYKFSKQIKDYTARNLFLNGAFFLDSRRHFPDKAKIGVYAHNPFYQKEEKQGENSVEKWAGLVSIRILQVLLRQGLPEGHVKHILKSQFMYRDYTIQTAISDCKDYGLVDTKLSPNLKKLHLEISPKGKILLNLIFKDLDVLYLLSMDSCVPKLLLTKKYIRPYNNKVFPEGQPIRSRYASSSILSAVSFLSFILQVDAFERSKLNLKNIQYPKLTIEDFLLPLDFRATCNLRRRFEQLYLGSSTEEREIIHQFIHEITEK